MNFALNSPKNSSYHNIPSIVSIEKATRWETTKEEKKKKNKNMFMKHFNSNTKYLYRREKNIF